jgi:hypothetical protein
MLRNVACRVRCNEGKYGEREPGHSKQLPQALTVFHKDGCVRVGLAQILKAIKENGFLEKHHGLYPKPEVRAPIAEYTLEGYSVSSLSCNCITLSVTSQARRGWRSWMRYWLGNAIRARWLGCGMGGLRPAKRSLPNRWSGTIGRSIFLPCDNLWARIVAIRC